MSKRVELLCLGERVALFGIEQVFRNAKGEIVRYAKLSGYQFGESYIQTDGKLPKRAEPLDEEKRKLTPGTEDRRQFEVHKLAVINYRRRQLNAYNLKKPHPEIVRAIELLRPFARTVDSIDLRRFMGYIENQLTKPQRRKKR